MKSMEIISNIIDNMDDTLFDKLNKATYDYWDLDPKVSYNGRKRLVYNLKKVGLTIDEWWAWCY